MKQVNLLRLKETARIALMTTRSHMLRSFLTLLGIIVSVSTLILVVSLIQGTNEYISDKVANLGSNVFIVTQFPIITDVEQLALARRRNPIIEWEDYEFLRDNARVASNVGAELGTSGSLRAENQTMEEISIRGVTPNLAAMDAPEAEQGHFVTETDNVHRTAVAYIGADIVDHLFPGVEPIGKSLRIDGRSFVVIGFAKRVGTTLGQSQDAFVYIPIQTFLKIYGRSRSLSLNVQAPNTPTLDAAQDETRMLMRARRHLAPADKDNFGVISASSLMGLWSRLTGSIAASMVGVVSVFLVIGGIVVMNVMLTSVTERTREIGLRKSIGATRHDLLLQVLMESALLTTVGGATGVIIALLLDLLLAAATSLPISVPYSAVILSLAVSTVIGLFFGAYPAWKASSLDPIEALRCE
jgi:putative ABC transport system permease protein